MSRAGWASAIALGLLCGAAACVHRDPGGAAQLRGDVSGALWAVVYAVGGLVAAAAVAVAVLVRWRRRPRPAAVRPAPPRPERWHCILRAHTPNGVVELRRGVVELAAAGPYEVGLEVVARYEAHYGCPPGVRYACSVSLMVGQ